MRSWLQGAYISLGAISTELEQQGNKGNARVISERGRDWLWRECDLPEEVTLKDDGNTEYETRRESRQREWSHKILWPHELVFGRWQRGLWQRAERVREGGEGTRGGHQR